MKKLLIYLCITVLALVFILFFTSKRKSKCIIFCEQGKCGQEDGCGGSCQCPAWANCINGNCCLSCGKGKCGSDGCGGICKCPTGAKCVDGNCCTPTCEQGKCGLDGCGGLCGCSAGLQCFHSVCSDIGTVTYTNANDGSLVTSPFTLGQQYLAATQKPLTLNTKMNISSITVEFSTIMVSSVWIYITDDQGNMPDESQVYTAFHDGQYTFPWQIQANSPKKFTIFTSIYDIEPIIVTFTDIS